MKPRLKFRSGLWRSATGPDALAQHLAAKILAIRAKHAASKTEMARYSVFIETPRGDVEQLPIEAHTLHDACHQHVRVWHSRVSTCAVVMRAPCGKRYSYDDSRKVVEGAHV